MTFGSLFAGIGGIDLGLERAGLSCRFQVEIDPFCRQVLAKHRTKRLKALGNAVVPQCAEYVGRRILEHGGIR